MVSISLQKPELNFVSCEERTAMEWLWGELAGFLIDVIRRIVEG